MKKNISEAFGTFTLVFAGTGAIVVNDVTGGEITHFGIALTFGLTVMAMIFAIGDVSGAHINPAVTIGFWLSGQINGKQATGYVAFQFLGALIASALLKYCFLPRRPTWVQQYPREFGGSHWCWILLC